MTMASGNDMKAARATYEGFIQMVKVATPIIAVIAATVVYLLAH
jgi:hypothetical protein